MPLGKAESPSFIDKQSDVVEPININDCPSCCRGCQLQKNSNMNISKLITTVFLALELLLGIITFGVEVGYEVCSLFIRYYSYHYLERNAREYLLRTRLVYTTVTAFPLIILPIIILPMFFSKRSLPSSLFMLLGMIGCGCYIASGAVTLASANLTWVPLAATQAFGALAITTGIVYLAHCAFEILRTRDDDVD